MNKETKQAVEWEVDPRNDCLVICRIPVETGHGVIIVHASNPTDATAIVHAHKWSIDVATAKLKKELDRITVLSNELYTALREGKPIPHADTFRLSEEVAALVRMRDDLLTKVDHIRIAAAGHFEKDGLNIPIPLSRRVYLMSCQLSHKEPSNSAWLCKILSDVEADISKWPDWLREAAGVCVSSPQQTVPRLEDEPDDERLLPPRFLREDEGGFVSTTE